MKIFIGITSTGTVRLRTNLDRAKMEHGWNKFKENIFL